MNSNELKERTKRFALNVIFVCDELPRSKRSIDILTKQLIRSATSIGANYRAACKAKSKADFICKINIVEEEADESLYWLELIKETKIKNDNLIDKLIKEADELTAIFTAIGKTTKQNKVK